MSDTEREERAKKQAERFTQEKKAIAAMATSMEDYDRLHRPGNSLTLPKSGTEYTVGNHGEWRRRGNGIRGKAARKHFKRMRRKVLNER